jgi:hypothetical protein
MHSLGHNDVSIDFDEISQMIDSASTTYSSATNFPPAAYTRRDVASNVGYTPTGTYFDATEVQTAIRDLENLGQTYVASSTLPTTSLDDANTLYEEKGGDIYLADALYEQSSGALFPSATFSTRVTGISAEEAVTLPTIKIKNLGVIGAPDDSGYLSFHFFNCHIVLDDSIATADKSLFTSNNISIHLYGSCLELDPISGATDHLTVFKKSANNYTYNIYLHSGSELKLNKSVNANRHLLYGTGGGTVNVYAHEDTVVDVNFSEINIFEMNNDCGISATSTGTPASIIGAARETTGAAYPTVPAPRDGDRHYNTTTHRWYYYDSSRSKWLSDTVIEFSFGHSSNLANNTFYGAFNTATQTASQAVPELMVITGFSVNQTNATNAGSTPNSTVIQICDGATPTVLTSVTINDATMNTINNSANVDLPATTGNNIGLRCRISGQGNTGSRLNDTQIKIRTRYKGV